MGQSVSQEHKLYLNALQQILRASRYKVTEGQIASLLIWVKDNCNWFPTKGTFDSKVWERVGEHLQM